MVEHRRTTGIHGVDVARSDDELSETVFKARGVEVHQKANTQLAHSEVGEKLGFIGGQNGGDALDFEKDGVFDNDIA